MSGVNGDVLAHCSLEGAVFTPSSSMSTFSSANLRFYLRIPFKWLVFVYGSSFPPCLYS